MSDEDVFRQRLMAKETGLRNLTKKYLAFVNSVETCTVEEAVQKHQDLMREIETYELNVNKAGSMVDTNLRQIQEYDALQQRIEAEM